MNANVTPPQAVPSTAYAGEIEDRDTDCARCGALVSADDLGCWRCGGDPFSRPSRRDHPGPEPSWDEREITRPATCHGCRQRFAVGTRSEAGDLARVYREGDNGSWRRYHAECWPWSE